MDYFFAIQTPTPTHNPPKLFNPFKKVTPIDTNCAAKAILSLVLGGGMGLFMGIFMNAVEYREFDYSRVKESTRAAVKMDMKRIWGTAKGFGVFGFFFSVFECQIEKARKSEDIWNQFYGGGLTTMLLAVGSVGPKGLIITGLGGGLFGMVMYKLFQGTSFMN